MLEGRFPVPDCMGKSENRLVSIVVPAYNIDAGLLDRCVQSIVGQTYPHIEALIVDDGSESHYAQAIDSACEGIANVMVIHKENGGVSSARNAALDAASGGFITFLDADDYLYSNTAIADAVDLMDRFDADMAFGQVVLEYPSSQVHESYGIEGPLLLSSADQIAKLADFFCSYSFPHACEFPSSLRRGIAARVIRRNLVDGICFNNEVHYGEDSLFDYYVTKRANRVVLVDDSWYVYCQYEDSAIRTIEFSEVIRQAQVLQGLEGIRPEIVSERIVNLFIRACTKEARNNEAGARAFKKAMSHPAIRSALEMRDASSFQNPKWKDVLVRLAAKGRSGLLYQSIRLGCVLSDLSSPLTRKR